MSTAISNAGPPLEYQSSPERIDGATVNIPLDSLEELYPDIQRFTAMALKFSYHPAHGVIPGSQEEELQTRRTRLSSILRPEKAGEETQIWPERFAKDAITCSFYHEDRKTGDIVLMRTLGFIIIDNEKTMAQRVWSSEMQQPIGQSSVEISDEHLDHCWFTEDEVRSAALYVKGTPPGPFAMILAKKDMVLLAFELFRQSQGQNVPPSFDIVR
ncbi:hypothetical protein N7524_007439 [Penicillium chrysogenum]|nr:hypothetical protein N7524_007439 [Penicillium chrysogenum]